jgi:quinohemoprotein ethanol dehydrogenase
MYKIASLLLAATLALSAQVRHIDDAALKNAGKTGEDWLTYGLSLNEQRFSPLNQINATNVSRLGLAWSADIGIGGGGQEATPLVANGVIYAITNYSLVFAMDARTGKEKWHWDPEANPVQARRACCGVVNRGIALYQDLVIAPVIDGRLVALDMETGKPRWEARVAWPQDEQTLTMAPRIAKGKVVIGVAGGDRPTRGYFDAFDAATGKHAWRFYTVPGDPSKPFENSAMRKAAPTWDSDSWKLGGGGAVWDGMSYDPPNPNSFTSAPATPNPGRKSSARARARTESAKHRGRIICTSVQYWPCTSIQARSSGITRWFPAIPGISTASSN